MANVSQYLQGIYQNNPISGGGTPPAAGQGAPQGTGNGFNGGIMGHILNFLFGDQGSGSSANASSPNATAQGPQATSNVPSFLTSTGAAGGSTPPATAPAATQTPGSQATAPAPKTGQGATVPGGSGTGTGAGTGTAPLGAPGAAPASAPAAPVAKSPTTTTSPATTGNPTAPSQSDQIAALIGPKPITFNPSDTTTAEGKDQAAFTAKTTQALETGATAQKTLVEQNRQNEIEQLQAAHTDQIAALRNKLAMGGGGAGNFQSAGAGLINRAQELNAKIVDATNTKYDIESLNIDANTKKAILDATEAHLKDLRDNYNANIDAATKYASNVIGEQQAKTAEGKLALDKSIAPSQIAQNYAQANSANADAAYKKMITSGGGDFAGYTKSANGNSKYIDMTSIPDAYKPAAFAYATAHGLSVLSGTQSTDMTQATIAKTQLENIGKNFAAIAPKDPASADYQKWLATPFTLAVQANPALGSYDSLKSSVIEALQGLSVGGQARMTQPQIDEIIKDGFPSKTEPLAQGMQKLDKLYGMLGIVQDGILGNNNGGNSAPQPGATGKLPDGTAVTLNADGFAYDASGNKYDTNGNKVK